MIFTQNSDLNDAEEIETHQTRHYFAYRSHIFQFFTEMVGSSAAGANLFQRLCCAFGDVLLHGIFAMLMPKTCHSLDNIFDF